MGRLFRKTLLNMGVASSFRSDALLCYQTSGNGTDGLIHFLPAFSRMFWRD